MWEIKTNSARKIIDVSCLQRNHPALDICSKEVAINMGLLTVFLLSSYTDFLNTNTKNQDMNVVTMTWSWPDWLCWSVNFIHNCSLLTYSRNLLLLRNIYISVCIYFRSFEACATCSLCVAGCILFTDFPSFHISFSFLFLCFLHALIYLLRTR